MAQGHLKLHYHGSLVWLIFWIILFFPIALALLFTDSTFDYNASVYHFRYGGSRFWLCFWVLFFFPIAFLLLFLNGFTVDIQKHV